MVWLEQSNSIPLSRFSSFEIVEVVEGTGLGFVDDSIALTQKSFMGTMAP